MKHYVYISDAKIDMLYGQVNKGEEEIEYSVEGEATLGIFSGKGTRKIKRKANIYKKLDCVLDELSDVGDIHSDADYIHGILPMSWNARKRLNRDSNATFWIGEDMNTDCIISKILLIGSYHNIVGNDKCSSFHYSTSYIDAFFNNILEKAVDFDTLEQHEKYLEYSKASEDMELITAVCNNDKIPSENEKGLLKNVINRPYLSEYIDELCKLYYGEYCEYEFTAKFLHSELRIEDDGTIIRYVIATPLFVALCTQQSYRIIMDNGRKKYMLTSEELEQHRKHEFQGMHVVLNNANMKEESDAFTNEMKQLYNSINREIGLCDKDTYRKFIEAAMLIVRRFFYIKE